MNCYLYSNMRGTYGDLSESQHLLYSDFCRQKQLYVLAASYLQTLNWHNDANIMKKIVQVCVFHAINHIYFLQKMTVLSFP